MRMPLHIGLILIFLLVSQRAWAQNIQTDPQQLISEIIEEMSSKSENEVDFTPIVEDLTYLLENPLNLNQCSIDDLSKLSFLSDFQITSLWDYIQANKPILSIYELQLIYGFEKDDVERIIPFITLATPSDTESLKNLIAKGHHEVITKVGTILENPKGYQKSEELKTTGYTGNKYSLFTRYSYNSMDKLECGLTADKDAGERSILSHNQNGADYISGYFAINNTRRIKKLIIGDFDAEFGQGLTFWSNLSAGKSSDPIGIRKRGRGLVKHSSTNENAFLRGAGVTIPIKRVELTLFGSYKKIDANIEDSLVGGVRYFSSLTSSGLHRTTSEIVSKDAINELIAGGNIFYKGKKVKAGVCFSQVRIDGNYLVDSTLYKLYGPSITERLNVGFNIEGFVKKQHIFSETAFIPENSEHAMLLGGLFKLSSLIDFSILLRSYSRGYTNIYTSAFAEGSGSFNENGVFSGISFQPLKGLKISGFVDIFSFPWLRYRVNAPSTGHEYLFQTEYQFNQNFSGLIRYRAKKTEQNYTSDYNSMISVIPILSQSVRLQLTFTPSKLLLLRSKFDFTDYRSDSARKENGYVLSQDIGYSHPKYPISISFRYAIFDTDSWNTRIYSFESDMLFTFSVPAYYSKGTRTYLMLKYSPTTRVDCWVRWSQTYYSDLKTIGQGLDLIEGNTRNDLRLMVRVRF